MKSVFIFSFSINLFISSPVNPDINPNVTVSIPNLFSIIDTFIPFPPGRISSLSYVLISFKISCFILIV